MCVRWREGKYDTVCNVLQIRLSHLDVSCVALFNNNTTQKLDSFISWTFFVCLSAAQKRCLRHVQRLLPEMAI